MNDQNQNKPNEKQIQIKMSDEMLKGSYANAMQVAHTQEEFILDFLNLSPHQGVGIVNSKVIMSPGHMKRAISALQENLKKYEDKFGKIEEASELGNQIGFKG
jgi:hypothetical protein